MDNDPLKEFIASIKSQEITWKQAGFNELMERILPDPDVSRSGFISGDDVNSILEQVSGSKILSGVTKSPDNVIEINWDEGYIQINFPGGGSLKHGNVGTDFSNNKLFGSILNDGTKNIRFEGFKKGAF